MTDIVLDISRLLSRVLHATPTGVDRVEMAYARGLLKIASDRLSFSAVHPIGIYGRLPRSAVLRFLDGTEARWENNESARSDQHRVAATNLFHLRPRPVQPPVNGSRILIQASPHHLTRPKLVAAIRQQERARFLCLVHDLIPLEFPEYARPDGAAQHKLRIETITTQADGIIANSHATRKSLAPWLAKAGTHPLVEVAHLGTHEFPYTPQVRTARNRPYFVSIGTIEPRKNHLLLLNLWRRMSEEKGPDAIPKLILIGRRGWENEQIVDMLERCPALVGCVEEYNDLSDRDTRTMLAGACALLMPSFAEGYGMPITEALDLGVPVVCSDLSALREAGAGTPVFLDPLDGPKWRKVIEVYADPASPDRQAQILRITQWIRPTWQNHMEKVNDLIRDVMNPKKV